MVVGMLWFDNDPKTGLDAKITNAAVFYAEKYKRQPNTCYLNPTMLTPEQTQSGDELIVSGLNIKTTRSILPNHFWIG